MVLSKWNAIIWMKDSSAPNLYEKFWKMRVIQTKKEKVQITNLFGKVNNRPHRIENCLEKLLTCTKLLIYQRNMWKFHNLLVHTCFVIHISLCAKWHAGNDSEARCVWQWQCDLNRGIYAAVYIKSFMICYIVLPYRYFVRYCFGYWYFFSNERTCFTMAEIIPYYYPNNMIFFCVYMLLRSFMHVIGLLWAIRSVTNRMINRFSHEEV